MDHQYKKVVEELKGLNWEAAKEESLKKLMLLAHASAREFAEALKIGLRVHKGNDNLAEMAKGELSTTNLEYGDYTGKRGDHSEFLAHFIAKAGLTPDQATSEAMQQYLDSCRALPDTVRADTVFSREHELGGIFEAILKNKHWTDETLQAFQYYLQRHIELDGMDGGHAALLDGETFPITDTVLPFYQARLQMYRVIPELFQNKSVMLPGNDEIMQRLTTNYDEPHIVENFYPLVAQQGGHKRDARGIVAMFTMAVSAYRNMNAGPAEGYLLGMVPEFIDVVVDDKDVATEAKEFLKKSLSKVTD